MRSQRASCPGLPPAVGTWGQRRRQGDWWGCVVPPTAGSALHPRNPPRGAGTPDLVTDPTSHNQNQPLWGLWSGQGPGEIPGPIRNSRRKGERLARSPSGIGDLLSRELRPRKCRLVKVPPSPPVFQPCLNHGQKVPKHPLPPGGGKSSPGRLGGSHHGTMALLGVAPLLMGHRWW